ncbi:MAG: VanZ family protein [Steroidobacteraceae bacterium]|jgi:VanZ family protein|nr:VanZ family protein [Steroidobacteraceae bacterium]
MLDLRLARLWALIGWVGVLAAVVVSLWPGGVPLPAQVWDKVQHGTGYALLTLWFTGLYPRGRYLLIGVACCLLGIAIEALQGLTATRSTEAADVLANSTGIAVALALAYTTVLGGWAQRVERLAGLEPRCQPETP